MRHSGTLAQYLPKRFSYPASIDLFGQLVKKILKSLKRIKLANRTQLKKADRKVEVKEIDKPKKEKKSKIVIFYSPHNYLKTRCVIYKLFIYCIKNIKSHIIFLKPK